MIQKKLIGLSTAVGGKMFYRWIYFVAQVFFGLVFKTLNIISRCTFGLLFFRIEVEGGDIIRKLKTPLIITPNHKSYCDHFFFIAAIIGNNWNILPARPMTANKFFKPYLVGWILKNLLGAYPTGQVDGLDVSLRNPLIALRENYMVAVYPEGGIRSESGVGQIRRGAAYLSGKSGSPILPAAIVGAEDLSLREFLLGRRTIRIFFGEPFHVGASEDINTASENVRSRILALYEGI